MAGCFCHCRELLPAGLGQAELWLWEGCPVPKNVALFPQMMLCRRGSSPPSPSSLSSFHLPFCLAGLPFPHSQGVRSPRAWDTHRGPPTLHLPLKPGIVIQVKHHPISQGVCTSIFPKPPSWRCLSDVSTLGRAGIPEAPCFPHHGFAGWPVPSRTSILVV